MTFDELRAAHPQLGFAVYAYDSLAAGGPVTLEIRTPVGEHFSFPGATLIDCVNLAFPYVPPAPVAPKPKQVDIFG